MKARIPRVLMLTAEYGPLHVGGLGSFLTSTCKAIDKKAFTPVVALPRSSYTVPWEPVTVHELPWCQAHVYRHDGCEIWLMANQLLDLAPIFPMPMEHARVKKFDDFGERVADALEMMDVDIVHLHDSFGYKCLLEARRLGKPTVFTVHRLHRDIKHEHFAEVVATRMADVTTSVGRSYVEDNPEFFGDPSQVYVVHNGVDPGFWRFEAPEGPNEGRPARRRRVLEPLRLPERPTFAYIGRLDGDQKGLDVLIDAFRGHVRARDLNLLVIGDGDAALRGSFQALAREAPDQVRFINRSVSHEEVREYMAAVDVALIPSRYEPFGIIQLEALSMGAIPVASATGGLKDVIVDLHREGGFGRLFDNGDAAALARAIDETAELLTHNPGHVATLRTRAASTAARYSNRNTAQGYERLYHTLLARGAHA
jgi:glycogen synthase